jgi:CBS domain-containing protein
MSVADAVVSDVMQCEVASLASGDRLDLAEDIMSLGRVRHLPVLEEGRLVGLVSQRDLLAASLSRALDFEASQRRTFARSIEVDEVMVRDVETIEPDAPLRDAAARMLRSKIGCLPVAKPDGTLVGLISESDLVRVAYLEEGSRSAVEADAPSPVVHPIEAELDALRRTRDELRVQAQLAKSEARDLWARLEHSFRDAESKVRHVLKQAEEPAEDVIEAARGVLEEVRTGYHRLRDLI